MDRDLGVMGFGGSGIWGLWEGLGGQISDTFWDWDWDLGIWGLGSGHPGTGIWGSGDWDLEVQGIWGWDEWIWGLGEARRPDPRYIRQI